MEDDLYCLENAGHERVARNAEIVVEIRGGVLVGLYTARNSVRAVLIDWDDAAADTDYVPPSFDTETYTAMPDETNDRYRLALERSA